MGRASAPDAIVVGAGPNGLAAGITLARAGRSVLVREAAPTVGGGARSAELTLPGFVHDVCSAIHPLAVASPFMREVPLERHGVAWVHSPAPLAHPLDGGQAVVLERSVAETAAGLGEDAVAYRRLIGWLADAFEEIAPDLLGPMGPPRHPFLMARFGLLALRSAAALARGAFRGERARALFAGASGHSILPLERPASGAFGLVLTALGHAVGWPFPRGGTRAIAEALAAYLRSLGGEIETAAPVASLDELPPARAILLDLTPRQVLRLAGDRLPAAYRWQLERYRYGPGVFKIDYALAGPVPWAAPGGARAATVHLGGTLAEIAASERAVDQGTVAQRPFVLTAQPSQFDPTRAPAGQHTLWAYCHVPNGSAIDMTSRVEAQIERFAPGFRDLILARHTRTAADYEAYNPNVVGGAINGGVQDLFQLYTRPAISLDPYRLPHPGLYICSSSTPPGGGVHGMCGYHAARSALRHEFA